MAVRKELKFLRIEHSISQKELAEKIGISTGAYALIERGVKTGSDKTWLKLQEVFNLTDEQTWKLKTQK